MVHWFEIPAADIQRAKLFYETIFDFKMELLDLGELKMALFPDNSGALAAHPQGYFPTEKGALLHLKAEPDLSKVLNRVPNAGGKVLVEKRQIAEERGFMGVFIDSEGNRLALHSFK